ncbi:fasciclin-like protein [Lentinula raphanica]|uniref:Fasciclin-like protein n=1 Tax=Lentinula raphanica TaxID=153919 RepID=A0AA38PCY2_9AGAR|nr:fasciclin-like protein [Lentinula raphanica]KAJ3758241.1 fasciclin-like protein [Lentinula raphanica]KAJ3776330.1 fasciclin-like protein [Lentinula raphanica]KAJ3828855.1 fasciclin-like protein [Lentinula raphanica]KAJ3840622.1 fasciclin-like protein [Lentinula raphanica]
MVKSSVSSFFFAWLALLVGQSVAQSSTSSAAGSAQTIIVTVSNSSSASNASSVFSPDQISANVGDLVLFNFTEGNHTATQSAFFAPCEPVNYTNGTNGFDSNFVVVPSNFSLQQDGAFPILAVPILESNGNETMWFYDVNTCAEGGVGVINLVAGDPATSGETLDGFRRNAIRLNGTSTSSSASHSSTGSSSSASATTSSSSQGNGAVQRFDLRSGAVMIIGLLLSVAIPLCTL